jgi:hypothetical protein
VQRLYLSRQCRDIFGGLKCFGETDHPEEVRAGEGVPDLGLQLSRQRRDNLGVRIGFSKAQHVTQVFTGKAAPIVGFQLFGQCQDDLFAVFGALSLQHFAANAPANLPIQHGQCAIDSTGQLRAAALDELANFAEKGLWR